MNHERPRHKETSQPTQFALRLKIPQTDSRLLTVEPILWMTQLIGRHHPFFSVDKVPVPQAGILGEHGEQFRPLYAGVCGSDKKILGLQMSGSAIADLPNVPPAYNSLPTSLIQALIGRGHSDTRVLRSFTPGHEIVALDSKGRVGVIFPLISCDSKFINSEKHCQSCQNGNQNLCQLTQEGHVRGKAIGCGAETTKSEELGGGFGESFVAFENQFILLPRDLDPKVAVMTDAYACAVNGVDMVKNEMVDTPTDVPILIIGMGSIGFSVKDFLRQSGKKNVTVLTRRDIRPSSSATFPLVFDCVGSEKSIADANKFASKAGHIVELGLPQTAKVDFNVAGSKQVTVHYPFWANRKHFQIALQALRNSQDTIAPIIGIHEGLQNIGDALYPKDRRFIKHAVAINKF